MQAFRVNRLMGSERITWSVNIKPSPPVTAQAHLSDNTTKDITVEMYCTVENSHSVRQKQVCIVVRWLPPLRDAYGDSSWSFPDPSHL